VGAQPREQALFPSFFAPVKVVLVKPKRRLDVWRPTLDAEAAEIPKQTRAAALDRWRGIDFMVGRRDVADKLNEKTNPNFGGLHHPLDSIRFILFSSLDTVVPTF